MASRVPLAWPQHQQYLRKHDDGDQGHCTTKVNFGSFPFGTLLDFHTCFMKIHTSTLAGSASANDDYYCRNKVRNACHLLTVMADIYNSYLRLRLLDVVLKKNCSSKAASRITMDSITHEGGTTFNVASENDRDLSYSVDLAIGLCSCLSGNTGAICKHQIACSQYSAVRLPQSFSFSAEDKRALARVVYGEKEIPDLEFFQDLKQPNDAPQHDSVIVEHTENIPSEQATTLVSEAEAPTPKNSMLSERVDSTVEYFKSLIMKYDNEEVGCAFDVFSSRMHNVKNAAQLKTFLSTAGTASFLRNGYLRRKILCQPTSVARRRVGELRGRGRVLQGGRGGVKRKRNLATNINKVQPNAKAH